MTKIDESYLNKQLDLLAERLAPKEFVARVRAFVLSDAYDPLIEESDGIGPDDAYRGAERRAEGLGAEAVAHAVALAALLPELLTSRSSRIRSFGIGLARATNDPTALWEQLKVGFQRAVAEEQTLGLLRGYLAGSHERNPEATGGFLDDAVEHAALAQVFPLLQTAVPLDAVAMGRLHRSLNAGRAPVTNFENLAYGRATDSIGSAHLVPLIDAFAARDGGWHVAAEILAMRFFSARNGPPVDAELVECGRRLLSRSTVAAAPVNHSASLRILVHQCLAGEKAMAAARSFCRAVIAVAGESYSTFSSRKRLITKLLEVQPTVALDELMESLGNELDFPRSHFWNDAIGALVDTVDEVALVKWLGDGTGDRFVKLAERLALFRGLGTGDQTSLSPTAITVIMHAPDRASVLERLRLTPSHTGASGSIAAVFEERRKSLGRLRELEDPVVDAWVAWADAELLREADRWRSFTSDRDERFE